MNKVVYITAKDNPTWLQASRLLKSDRGLSVSAFIVEQLRKYVAQHAEPTKRRKRT